MSKVDAQQLHSPEGDSRETPRLLPPRVARRVLHFWPVILACAIAGGAGAYLATAGEPDRYRATASVAASQSNPAALFVGTAGQSGISDPEQEAASIAQLINLPNVRERASRMLEERISPDDLSKVVKTETNPDSRIVDVIATDEDPVFSRDIANAMVRSFTGLRRDTAREGLRQAEREAQGQYSALSKVQKASAAGRQLRDQLRQIALVRAVANGGVDIVQTARVPTISIGSSPKRRALLGLLGGGLLGLLGVFARVRLDDRIHDAHEFTELWPELPVVGTVPRVARRHLGTARPSNPQLADAFAFMRTRLRYLPGNHALGIITVTGAQPEQGASSVAWGLGIAAAAAGDHVLVVDGDLRDSKLSTRLKQTSGDGLSEILAGLSTAGDAITRLQTGGGIGVDFLRAGIAPPSSSAALEQNTLSVLFAALRQEARYDLILITSPPATSAADALSLMAVADATLLVSRVGSATRTSAMEMREQLASVDHNVIAQVLTAVRRPGGERGR